MLHLDSEKTENPRKWYASMTINDVFLNDFIVPHGYEAFLRFQWTRPCPGTSWNGTIEQRLDLVFDKNWHCIQSTLQKMIIDDKLVVKYTKFNASLYVLRWGRPLGGGKLDSRENWPEKCREVCFQRLFSVVFSAV